jgi:hypothetical protein
MRQMTAEKMVPSFKVQSMSPGTRSDRGGGTSSAINK